MQDIITQSNFPIKVLLDGQEFIHYSAFSVRRSIDQFIDTFALTCNNPWGRYSTTISVGAVSSFWYNGVELFRGYIEKKNVAIGVVWNFMMLSGREEIVSICEDDIDPQLAQFKKTTDNAIITKLLEWKWYILDLGTAYPVKEISWQPWMTIAQLVEDTTKYSDCILIKKGNYLIKRKIPTWPTWRIIPLRITKESWALTIYNSKILDVKLEEDITQAKWYMTGYSYETWKKKKNIYAKTENKVMTSGSYGGKLRNLSQLKWPPIKYMNWITSSAKEQSEVQAQVRRAQRETDIKISITLTIAWFFDVQLLDTIDVFIEQEQVQQYMYVSSIEYSFDKINKSTTILEITSYPSL